MDMKKILATLDGVASTPVTGSNDMKKFLSIIKESSVAKESVITSFEADSIGGDANTFLIDADKINDLVMGNIDKIKINADEQLLKDMMSKFNSFMSAYHAVGKDILQPGLFDDTQGLPEGVGDLGYDAQSLIMKLRRDVEDKRLQPTRSAVLAAANELAGDMKFAPELLVQQVLGRGVEEADELRARGGIEAVNKKPRAGQTDYRDIPAGNYPGSQRKFSDKDRAEQPSRLKSAIKATLGKHTRPNLPEQSVAEGSAHGYNVTRWYRKNRNPSKITAWLKKEAGLPKETKLYFDDADLVLGSDTIVPEALVDDTLKFNDLLTALVQATGGTAKQKVDGVYRASDVAEGLSFKDYFGLAESLKTDNPCWKGYKPVGTKKKNGKTVPNCVPKK